MSQLPSPPDSADLGPSPLDSQELPPPAICQPESAQQSPAAADQEPSQEPPVVALAPEDTPAALEDNDPPVVLPAAKVADDFPEDADHKYSPSDGDQATFVPAQGPTDEEQQAAERAVNAEEDICEHPAGGVPDQQEPPVDGGEGQTAAVVGVEEDILCSGSPESEPAKHSSQGQEEETPVEIASGVNQEEPAHADKSATNGDRELVIESHESFLSGADESAMNGNHEPVMESHESFVSEGEEPGAAKTAEPPILHSHENGMPLENGLEPGQDVNQKSEKAQEADDEEELQEKSCSCKDRDGSAGIGVSGLKSPLIFTGVVLAVLGVAVACLKRTR